MTDKQIIFDDVDVKDCIAYAKSQTVYLGNTAYKQMEKICMVKNQPCKFFDCQFKQMARELKAKEQRIVELNKTIQTKEQECEELKELVKKQKDVLIHKTILADEYESAYLFENTKVAKLKYSLTEIKEIAKNGCYDDCGMPLDELSIILQKISECEGNNEYS